MNDLITFLKEYQNWRKGEINTLPTPAEVSKNFDCLINKLSALQEAVFLDDFILVKQIMK